MPPSKHALLSASSSKRWLVCPPSARLCERIKEATSFFAKEGTEAHELCEYKLRKMLGENAVDPTPNLEYYNEEMDKCSDDYAEYITEIVETEKADGNTPVVLIEQELDFSSYVPDGFGTGDCIIISGSTVYVMDFKFGQGLKVDAEKNSQMMCYAIGAYEALKDIYDIKTVVMTIFQPRRENISTYTVTTEELLDWANNVLAPTAKLAYNGEGDFAPGDHCQFCKVKFTCRARAEYHTKLLSMDFKEPELLTTGEIAEVLKVAETLTTWVDEVKQYALGRAMKGVRIDGYKIVAGRANRKITNEKKVVKILTDAGYDVLETKLKNITTLEKMLGKKRFNELVGSYITKPAGKPTLVKNSDKRPEYSTKNDF